jgi:hypothetical protein
MLPERWTDTEWYSAKYWVPANEVHWTAKPTDCDGKQVSSDGKGCHFQKNVIAYNAAGEPVAGDNVPRCKHDLKVGRNIITYDGRTWASLPLGKACPDLKATDVEVSWTKIP